MWLAVCHAVGLVSLGFELPSLGLGGLGERETPMPSFDTGLEWVSYDWAQIGHLRFVFFFIKINPDSASYSRSGSSAGYQFLKISDPKLRRKLHVPVGT
eukprot:SAG31_NODE_1824_length_7190_cov_43.812015_6_plen_99_part_00